MIQNFHDAIIIGAGPGGLAAAITLAQGNWKVAVIERQALPRPKICGGFIGPENREILEKLGVLDPVRAIATSVTQLSLHAAGNQSVTIPVAYRKDQGSGWGVSRAAFDQILVHQARRLGVDVFDRCSATTVPHAPEKVLTLKSPLGVTTVRGRHLIQATGSPKSVKERAGLGAGALFENCAAPEGDVALYFLHGGHLGINRFENGRVNACYVIDHWLFEKLNKNMNAVFEHFLTRFPALKEQFAHARQMMPFKGIGVSRPSAARFTREGSFLVGDAVDIINPVIGGGNSMALASGIMLAQTLLKHADRDASFDRLAGDYRRQWKKSFAPRVAASWVLGHLSHQTILATNTIRLFKWRQEWLKRIFQYSHRPLEFQS